MSFEAIEEVAGVVLDPPAKAVLLWMAFRASKNEGIAWPGAADICRATCLNIRTVRRALKELRDSGFLIEVQRGMRGVKHYRVTSGRQTPVPQTPDHRTGDRTAQGGCPEDTGTRDPQSATSDGQTPKPIERQEVHAEGSAPSAPLATRAHSQEDENMGPLRSRGCKIDHRDAKQQQRLRAEWINACRGLTIDEVAEVIDSGGKPVHYASDFAPLRAAWEQRTGWQPRDSEPRQVSLSPEEVKAEAARKAQNAAKIEAAKRRSPEERKSLCAILDCAKGEVLQPAGVR